VFCLVDMAEELCDGNAPLKDPRTRLEYSCDVGQDTCPAGSYCHKVGSLARCCREGGCEGGVMGILSKVVSQGYSQKWCHRDNLYKNCNRDILKSAPSKRGMGHFKHDMTGILSKIGVAWTLRNVCSMDTRSSHSGGTRILSEM